MPKYNVIYKTDYFKSHVIIIWFHWSLTRYMTRLNGCLWESDRYLIFYSLWASGVKWWHRSVSTLARLMTCCLSTPRHNVNQCWFIIGGVLWHPPKIDFTVFKVSTHKMNLKNNALVKMSAPLQSHWDKITVKHAAHTVGIVSWLNPDSTRV